MIKARDLIGRAVRTLSDAARFGEVDAVLFDAGLHRVVGFRVKTGRLGKGQAVARADVTSISRDAVTVTDAAAVDHEFRLAALASSKTLTDAMGTEVMSEGGDVLGTLAALELDDEARAVTGFVLSAPWWDHVRHHDAVISSQRLVRSGDGGIMLVPTAMADRCPPSEDP